MALGLSDLQNKKKIRPQMEFNLEQNPVRFDEVSKVRPWESHDRKLKDTNEKSKSAEDAVKRAHEIVKKNNEMSIRLRRRALELSGESNYVRKKEVFEEIDRKSSVSINQVEDMEFAFETNRSYPTDKISDFVKSIFGW